MRKLKYWDQLLGKTIDNVTMRPDSRVLQIWVDDSAGLIEIEPDEYNGPLGIDVTWADPTPSMPSSTPVELDNLIGKVICKIIVPYTLEGFNIHNWVTIGFTNHPDIALISENNTTPLRIV